MTDREAIIELDSIAHDFEDERLDTEEWCGYEYDPDEAASAVRMGIRAIEKQTPKTPTGGGNTRWHCPICGNWIAERQHFCDKCGQAIKW